MHAKMNDKRFNKLDPLKSKASLFQVYGDPTAPLAMIAWGSIAGVAREAFELRRPRASA
jgi:pyruvate/2-oxoacid:ferredoxin oxidoreductase alpha subunit